MKLFLNFLCIGIILACIYFSLGAQENENFTKSPNTSRVVVNKKLDSIKLFNFQGIVNGNKIELQWMVHNNESINQFEIEKKTDGKNFKLAALVFGTDKMNTESYMFYEKASEKKAAYRIKIIENNGTVGYSGVIELNPNTINNTTALNN
ncbi:MAG: hypothetical protein JST17_07645 [Bacteroidetes bacterium]|nr:hypothetical protein [Bacteroidota bacterium]MBS1931607.1 hypothetical protein [Bacteroidota bacterium]